MRCPSNLVLELVAGLVPLLCVGCHSSSGLGPTAGAGVTTSETGQSITGGAQPVAGSSGGAGAGGAPRASGDTDVLSSTGGKRGGAGSPTTSGPPTGGTAGAGGVVVNPGGSRTGGATVTMGGGGISSVGGTTGLGGSSVAGWTSGSVALGGTSNPGGNTGGTSSNGGATIASSRPGPVFPVRFVGNIDAAGRIPTDFSQYWDQFTPENAGKWPSVQGASRTTFRWDSLDAMYGYTQENNIVFKESCFIWGASPPSWLTNDNIIESAKIWMKAFCDRYPNTRLINVVNEPLHMTPSYANGLGGGTRTTWDWVANSFKMAREACPNAVLIINDYNICEYETDHQKFLELMNAIKKLEAPVDAIGCQSHDAAKVSVAKFKGYLDDLASQTGLPIYITEFDVDLADDEKQRAQYADYFPMFWDDPNVKGATIWGYITGKTWRTNTGLMSSEGTMRPAMTWLMDFLKR